jgi:hypothetical protein
VWVKAFDLRKNEFTMRRLENKNLN